MSILPDTCVWIDFSERGGQARLEAALEAGDVVAHPFVTGELVLGAGRDHPALGWLDKLQTIEVATPGEVRFAIQRHCWGGRGIGYVDAHLLVSTLFTPGCSLLTTDKRVLRIAEELGIAA